MKIALIAPSSPASELTPASLEKLHALFAERGCQIHVGSHALDKDRYLAGCDADRAADIMRAFVDDSVDAVMTVRGGYGSPRILDKLDYAFLSQHRKPFFTFSDGTALQTALYTRSGITGYSGVQATFWLSDQCAATCESFWRVVSGERVRVIGLKTVQTGQAQGVSVGGNLVVLTSLLGTPYFPDMTGKILILEEVNEEPYKVDRMLAQLKLSGVLSKIVGLVLGDFSTCVAKSGKDGTIAEVLRDYTASLQIPVASGLKYGHKNGETVIPIGKPVCLNANEGTLEEMK